MTTRGTQNSKPSQVRIKRRHDNGTVDIAVKWDIQAVTETDPDTGQESEFWEYEREVLRGVESEVPETKYENWVDARKEFLLLKAKAKASDLTAEEMRKIIDVETGKRIDNRIHEASGVDEQLGRARYSITKLYNELGIEIPPELKDWNTVANEAIKAGQDKKSDL